MRVFLTPEFINDLKRSNNIHFINAVFSKVLNKKNVFQKEKDDHRYKGIDDAWIRYVTAGKTAFRLIYIQKGKSIYFYRAGHHSIEDHLTKPRDLSTALPVVQPKIKHTKGPPFDYGIFLETKDGILLRKVILSLYHLSHNEIYLISPFLSANMLSRNHHFGRFLDRAVEENTIISLITRPPDQDQFGVFDDLEARSIFVYYYPNLHTKLYIFDINLESLSVYSRDVRRTAIIGSANLTEQGFALDNGPRNEELCYRIPHMKFFEALVYARSLQKHSADHVSYKSKTRRF